MPNSRSAYLLDCQIFSARHDLTSAQIYVDALDSRIDEDPSGLSQASLMHVSLDELVANDARVVMKTHQDVVMAGLYAARQKDGALTINGVIKAPFADSRMPRVVLFNAVVDAARHNGEHVRLTACYRQFPAGWVDRFGRSHAGNKASARLFNELLFRAEPHPRSHVYLGTCRDASLRGSLEADGITYRATHVHSTAGTVHRARKLLRDLAVAAGEARP